MSTVFFSLKKETTTTTKIRHDTKNLNHWNIPGNSIWSLSERNADPGMDRQPKEEISRTSRRLEDGNESDMMLERETVSKVREGQSLSGYNYQVDSMMA